MKVLIGIGIFFLTTKLRVASAQCGRLLVGTLVPNESDCGLYYACDGNGNAVSQECIEGYYFDPARKYCRPSSEVPCGSGFGTLTTAATAKSTVAPTAKPTASLTAAPTAASTTAPVAATTSSSPSSNYSGEECSNLSVENEALLPYPNDCSRFIQCSNGIPVVKKCPSNLHFNIAIRVCDWPTNAGCSKVPPISTECSGAGVTNGDLLPYPGDCEHFIQCSNGMAVVLSCPKGLYFNESSGRCDWPSSVKCSL